MGIDVTVRPSAPDWFSIGIGFISFCDANCGVV